MKLTYLLRYVLLVFDLYLVMIWYWYILKSMISNNVSYMI